jgi:hypothetical protein
MSERTRALVVWGLVALGTLVVLVGSLTVWTKRQVYETNSVADAGVRLLRDDDVRGALAIYLTDELFAATDVQKAIAEQLPPAGQPLAPVLSGALREFTVRAADRLLESPRVQETWELAVRQTHELLLAVLEEKDVRGPITTDGAEVILDLRPLLERLVDQVGIAARLEPDAGRVVILRSEQLDVAKTAMNLVKALSSLLMFLALGLYAGAVWLARGRRMRVLAVAGAAVFGIGLLLLAARRVAGQMVVDALAGSAAVRPAVDKTWLVSTELLAETAGALVTYGLLGLLAAWLGSTYRPAAAVRRRSAPWLRDYPVPALAAVLGVFLLFVVVGPAAQGTRVIGLLVLLALAVGGGVAFRRRALAELEPDAVAMPAEVPPAAPTAPTSA